MRLSQLAPLPVRQAVWKSLEFSLIPPAQKRPRPTDGPVVIAGMFSSANGLGQSARYAHEALKSCGVDVQVYDTSPILGQSDIAWEGETIPSLPDTREGLLVIYNNAPEVGRILLYTGRRTHRDWCVASLWAWETPQTPRGWLDREVMLDELWFPSKFVEGALTPTPPTRSIVAFHPIPPVNLTRDDNYIVPADVKVFTCYADARSSLIRKNPLGAIEAFRNAFGESMGVRLIVKTRNSTIGADRKALDKAVGDAPNIIMMDRPIPRAELSKLRARTDVLVSLHRSEGFGLPIAEAMQAGTPTIVTNWSAPAEFVDEDSAYLVPATEIPADDMFGVYREAGHTWADPDLKVATEQMLKAVEDPAGAAARAENALKRADQLFSAEAYRKAVGL